MSLVARNALLLLLPACAGTGPRVEPGVIVVRNEWGSDLASASLQVPAERGRPARLGRVSPVPRGASQVYVRPDDPPPLGDVVEVVWVDGKGQRFSDRVALKRVLSGATGAPDEALVFAIHPLGVSVSLERRAR